MKAYIRATDQSIKAGTCLNNDFDVDYYIANCNKEQKDIFVDKVLAYMSRMIKK